MNSKTLALVLALFASSSPSRSLAETLEESLFAGAKVEKTIIQGELTPLDSPIARMTVRILIFNLEAGITSTCTGTLLSSNLVLTAAHCLQNSPSPSQVRIVSASGWESSNAEDYRLHENFSKLSRETSLFGLVVAETRPANDIALIKLKQPLGAKALAAELPQVESENGSSLDVVIAGFGKTNAQDRSTSLTLQFAWSRGTFLESNGDDQHILLEGAQTCNGDSGGPAYAPIEKKYVVVGVASHGKMDCSSEGRMVAVGHHLNWIKKTAKELLAQKSI